MEAERYATREDLARLETDLVREVKDGEIRLTNQMHGVQTRVLFAIISALLAAVASLVSIFFQ